MTRCEVEFERLSAFADGELDSREELDLRRHLERCDRCRAIIETLLGIKAAVASSAEVRPVPHSLRERVSEVLTQRPAKRRVRALLIPSLAAAAIVLFTVIYRPMFGRKADGADRLTLAMVEDHIHYLTVPGAIQVATDDPQQIAQAFANQFAFPLELPVLRGVDLLGGRLCWLQGQKAVLTFYQTPSARVSLFVLDRQAFAETGRQRTRCTSTGGYEVCLVWRAPEVLAMVADKQEAALIMPEFKKLAASEQP